MDRVKSTKPNCVKDWTLCQLKRFPRPEPPPSMPPLTSFTGLWPPFHPLFDDYEDGPTLDSLDRLPETIYPLANPSLAYIAGQILHSPWTTFKDYGWRTMPSYAHTFHNRPPVMVLNHFMPIGLLNDSQEDIRMQTDAFDMVTMGASQMIDASKRSQNCDIFLTGRTKDRCYVRVDLEKDSVEPEKVLISWDFDSLIWVTSEPRFKSAISIIGAPQIRSRSPIWKHNHIYVDLLVPPSLRDREVGGLRSEWWEKRFRLSQLPHTFFGKLGDGSGIFNLYIFFPRMAHQNEYTRRWASIVPTHILHQFWEKVVRPAMVVATDLSMHPYIGLSQAQHDFKSASAEKRHGNAAKVQAYPFRTQAFLKLIECMKYNVSNYHTV
jgi:hypothetical protein